MIFCTSYIGSHLLIITKTYKARENEISNFHNNLVNCIFQFIIIYYYLLLRIMKESIDSFWGSFSIQDFEDVLTLFVRAILCALHFTLNLSFYRDIPLSYSRISRNIAFPLILRALWFWRSTDLSWRCRWMIYIRALSILYYPAEFSRDRGP